MLSIRDAVAALLIGTIMTPYAGMLLLGQTPYVSDVPVMAALSLVIAAGAFLIADRITVRTPVGRVELGLAAVTVALGMLAMVFGATSWGQALLGAFVTGILLTWVTQLLDHAGYPHDPKRQGPAAPVSRGTAKG